MQGLENDEGYHFIETGGFNPRYPIGRLSQPYVMKTILGR